MSFISIGKSDLQDPNFSFQKEYLETNKLGAYSSSSIAQCNTRKYHGLLVVPQPKLDGQSYVLLNNLDESILVNDAVYQLGAHQYPNIVEPKGYGHLEQFSLEKIPTWLYNFEGIQLKKELLLCKHENRVLIKYTSLKGNPSFTMRLDPFMSFRQIHQLNKYNTFVNSWMTEEEHGISYQMYDGFDELFLQNSKLTCFTPQTDWFFNNEYHRELERGYDYKEDLFRIGYFELELKAGEEIIFSAGTSALDPDSLKNLFNSELKQKKSLMGFSDYLEKAADQFISESKNSAEITAGFHWFGRWGRDTFIALPGLTLSTNQAALGKKVMDTMLGDLKNGLLTNIGVGEAAQYNSADASLWFFWSLQEYAIHTNTKAEIWGEYGDRMQNILNNYQLGTHFNIKMQENGLLFGGAAGVALTWMDAMVEGNPVTQRKGLAVDLNALWYNAICFALETASLAGDTKFVQNWQNLPKIIQSSFEASFWNESKGYLADVVFEGQQDLSLRPNQIFAISLPHALIEGSKAASILNLIKERLLTPRGLRTLSPEDDNYQAIYKGDQKTRDRMYHQGIVWPWLLGHFAGAYLKTFPKEGEGLIKNIYSNFEDAILEYGLGSVAEIYNAEPPFKAEGTISQAWSVSELLRIKQMISKS